MDDLVKYGEYLSQELKVSNDTNTELLENYINLSSKLKSKNKQNTEINDKIKQLKEKELQLNKANEEIKKNYLNAQSIIEKNNLSLKNNIFEAQKNYDIKQQKIAELYEKSLNLKNTQKKRKSKL